MFSFFKKTPTCNRLNDLVWIDSRAKYLHFYHHLISGQQESDKTVVITFFQQSFDDLRTIFEKMELTFLKIEDASDLAKLTQNTTLLLVNLSKNEQIITEINDWLKNQSIASTIFFHFFEHYPILSLEKKVIEHIALQLGKTATVTFYTALDEPFFKLFGGERLVEILKRMGWEGKDEPLAHSMITKSIERAQKKIEQKIAVEAKAHSQMAWFELNPL